MNDCSFILSGDIVNVKPCRILFVHMQIYNYFFYINKLNYILISFSTFYSSTGEQLKNE